MHLPWPIHFNYKVHALNTLEGFITSFEITPASIYEREGFGNLLAGHCAITFLSDKRYVGEAFTREMKEQGMCKMSS